MPIKNRVGERFGRLVVQEKDQRKDYWICLCDCGTIRHICISNLLSGGSQSCGCYNREQSHIRMSQYHTGQGVLSTEEKGEHRKDSQRHYRETHQEEINARARQVYAKNPEKQRGRTTQYLAKHPEKRRLSSARQRTKNKEKSRLYSRRYYAVHREGLLLKAQKNRRENPEKVRLALEKYRKNNPEKVRISAAKTRKTHPETHRINEKRRRAARYGAPINDLTNGQWLEIQKAFRYRCVYCGKKSKKLTMDHIVPLSKGGSHTLTNIVPACQSCNSKKHTAPPRKPVQPLLLTIS